MWKKIGEEERETASPPHVNRYMYIKTYRMALVVTSVLRRSTPLGRTGSFMADATWSSDVSSASFEHGKTGKPRRKDAPHGKPRNG